MSEPFDYEKPDWVNVSQGETPPGDAPALDAQALDNIGTAIDSLEVRVGVLEVEGANGTPDDGSVTNAKVAVGAAISADKLADGSTNKVYTATEKTKLAGVAPAATANDTDANLKARANHTGSQATSTVTGLDSALTAKAPLASPAFTGTPTGITKAHVGLGSVDNTADTAKPVSTAQQAALDALPLRAANTDLTGAGVDEVLTVGPTTSSFRTRSIDELIDPTPVTAADFGLVAPQGARAYANATGQTIASAAYPVYLDLNATEYNDNGSLFTVDLTNNRITVVSGGLFLASIDVNYADTASGLREAYFTKNGGNALFAASAGAGGLTYRTFPMRLAAADYVQVICYVEGSTVSLITSAPFRCGLALHRIGL